MDAKLIALFERLSEDLANLAKVVAHYQDTMDKILHEVRKNGKAQEKRLDTIQATQRFLANQQPRWSFHRPLENDDHE